MRVFPFVKAAAATPLLAAFCFLLPVVSQAAGSAPQPNICTRGCWGAQAPRSSSYMSSINRAIVHHTAGNEFSTTGYEDSKANVRAIQNQHRNVQGWSDIGYHFLVDKFGYTFEGRYGSMSSLPIGAHDGTNSRSFGFNMMGYFHTPRNDVPTAAMLNALYNVIAWRMPNGWQPYGSPGQYGPLGNSVGYLDAHRRVKSTACPGDHVFNPYMGSNMNAGTMRAEIKKRIDGTAIGTRVGIARAQNGQGYWIADAGGGVFSFGPGAPFYGSLGAQSPTVPIVGIVARPQGDGYWLFDKKGAVFSFGAAPYRGGVNTVADLNDIVGMAPTADGNGYWIASAGGGVFTFNAPFHGSLGNQGVNNVVGITSAPNTNGYWLVLSTGNVFSFGTCCYYGGGEAGEGVVAIVSGNNGGGYWQVKRDGAVFTYGNLQYGGNGGGPIFVGMCPGPSSANGYWLVKDDGAVFSFGDAPYYGGANF